mgnify:CR=1 FL=1
MKVKRGLSLALALGTVISLFGAGVTAEAAVVTGGNAIGGFSLVSNDFFVNAAEEDVEDTTELFSKVSVPEGCDLLSGKATGGEITLYDNGCAVIEIEK